MKEYLTTILLVAAVTAVVGMLGGEGKMKKSVSFGLSLAVLAVIVLPLAELIPEAADAPSRFPALDFSAEEGKEWFERETVAAVGEGIRAVLCERYAIKEAQLSVACEGNLVDNTVILRRVQLTLSGAAVAADVPGMVRYIEENTGATCEVLYGK